MRPTISRNFAISPFDFLATSRKASLAAKSARVFSGLNRHLSYDAIRRCFRACSFATFSPPRRCVAVPRVRSPSAVTLEAPPSLPLGSRNFRAPSIMSHSAMNTISSLPTDLVLEIMKWLPCPATLRIASTCKRSACPLFCHLYLLDRARRWRDVLYYRWRSRIGDWYRQGFPLTYAASLGVSCRLNLSAPLLPPRSFFSL